MKEMSGYLYKPARWMGKGTSCERDASRGKSAVISEFWVWTGDRATVARGWRTGDKKERVMTGGVVESLFLHTENMIPV